jgi:hypothetical protein
MKPSKNLTVNYVDADGKIKPAKVLEVVTDQVVLLDHSQKDDEGEHTARAAFNDDKKTPNTWHYPAESANGAAPKLAAAKPTA